MRSPSAFPRTNDPEPHQARTKAILRSHPQVRALIGRNPGTFVILVAIVALQVALAVALRSAPWW